MAKRKQKKNRKQKGKGRVPARSSSNQASANNRKFMTFDRLRGMMVNKSDKDSATILAGLSGQERADLVLEAIDPIGYENPSDRQLANRAVLYEILARDRTLPPFEELQRTIEREVPNLPSIFRPLVSIADYVAYVGERIAGTAGGRVDEAHISFLKHKRQFYENLRAALADADASSRK